MSAWLIFLLPVGIGAQGLDPAAILHPAPGSWPTYNGDYTGRRYSALTQIESARGGSRNDAVQLAEAFASTMLGAGSADAVADALGQARLHDQAKQYMIEIARTRPGDFTRLTSDPDASRRAELAEILGLTDSPAALPAAETLAKDPAPNVSQAAQRAVERLKAASTRPS